MPQLEAVAKHLESLRACTQCPLMIGPVVTPQPVLSKVYLVGQAPGPHEGKFGKPFAWTAGKTLFRWFGTIGLDETQFRERVFMAAVCRCFPGKAPAGGDRVPTPAEIENCSAWMKQELDLLEPNLVIPVGKLAINQFLPEQPLVDTIGKQLSGERFGHRFDLIPLPHPSGASTWFKREPGLSLLAKALTLIEQHPSWQSILK
ncbi:MAG: uracil-DNA glycosylase family protein [Candidatus Obscuribacterales bacterium]|jgi:uracil-DNA glycosylase